MTTLPQQETIKQYLGNNLTLIFTYPFMILESGDIKVYVTLAGQEPNPALDIKELNTDYTVQGVGQLTGGTITFIVPPAFNAVVTLSREIEAKVNTAFAEARNIKGENLDLAFLRSTLVEQQNRTYALKRNLSYKINSYLPELYILNYTQVPILGNFQIWQGTENGVIAVDIEENPDISLLRSQLANASIGSDGARLVGYYDELSGLPTTVQAFLAQLTTSITKSLTPTGMVRWFAGSVVPAGWLECNGALVSKTLYADLYAVIGDTYGTPGPTTFQLPTAERNVFVGRGGDSTDVLGNTVGSYGGDEEHILAITEMPAHNHPGSIVSMPNTATNPAGVEGRFWSTGTAPASMPLTITSQGGGDPHNIMQPSLVMIAMIKT